MKANIKINGKKAFAVDTSMRWLRIYRDTFGHDVLPDIVPLIDAGLSFMADAINGKDINTDELETQMYAMEFVMINNVIWALAKNADDKVGDPEEWEDSFDKFPLDEIMPQIVDVLATSYISTKKLKPLKEWLKTRRSQLTSSSYQESTED